MPAPSTALTITDTDDPWETMEVEAAERDRRQKIREAAQATVSRLTTLAAEAVRRRSPIELRWLDNLRAYQGRYDEDIEKMLREAARNGQPRSRAYVKICRSKTDAWEARLSDLLFPADDRNYGINPTPVPELDDEAQRAAQMAEEAHIRAEKAIVDANTMAANGSPEADVAAKLDEAAAAGKEATAFAQAVQAANFAMAEAKKRAEQMTKEIDDQLTECLYPKRSRDAIRDLVRLGSGVMKGPLASNRPRASWTKRVPSDGQDGADVFDLVQKPDARPEYRRTDPWHFFPDWNATSIEDCEWTLERHLPTKRDLRRMAKHLGFDEDAVRALLKEGPGYGAQSDLEYLTQLRAITNEGDAITDRFVMWEYNGNLESDEIVALLAAAGREDEALAWRERDDPLDEHMVTVWFCNNRMLKLEEIYPLDSGETLYSVVGFSPGEASVLGSRGVPDLMLDTLRALNAAWRMMLDNAALSVAPQIVVNKAVIEAEDGSGWRLTPGKVWVRTGDLPGPHNTPPFEVHNLPINQAAIAGIIDLALKFIDEETSLPLIAQGEQGAHQTNTMGGMSMLFNSANVVFRRVVKNWDDDITTPNIRRLYHWNMQFNPKAAIKGDMQVEARGTSVLLVREVQSQNLMIIAQNWTSHPILGAAVKAYGALRMAVQSLGINPDDILETEEIFKKNMAAMSQGQPSPDVIRAEATLKAAQITAESRKVDSDTRLQIANMNRETAIMELAIQRDLTIEQVRSRIAERGMDIQSKERQVAAEIGAQKEARQEAKALGQEAPRGGGGLV